VPSCPKHLSEPARKEWRRITKILSEVGLLTELDRTALALYCEAYAEYIEASEQIRQHGLLLKSPLGYPTQSPYLSIRNRAAAQMRSYMLEFGMTPAARSRVTVSAPEQRDLFEEKFGV